MDVEKAFKLSNLINNGQMTIHEERFVSEKLIQFIDSEEDKALLLTLPVPCIDRILILFYSKNKNIEEEKELKIMNFLFEMLDTYKKAASPLFASFNFTYTAKKCIAKLLDPKYYDIFNFSFLSDKMARILAQKIIEDPSIDGSKIVYDTNDEESYDKEEQELRDKLNALKEKSDKIEIPDGIKEIIDYDFYISPLSTVVIPKSVQSIGNSAFKYCQSLTDVQFLSDYIKSIGEYAFLGCVNLKQIKLPAEALYIGQQAFSGCAFTEINIPIGIKSIENSLFGHCTSLQNITIPSSVTVLKESSFGYCTSLQNITIPSSVTVIESGAFYECTGIKSIDLPKSLTSIEPRTFYHCSSLKNITIPSSVKLIKGPYTFYACRSIERIDIPSSVEKIEDEVFLDCQIKYATISSTLKIEGSGFGGLTLITII